MIKLILASFGLGVSCAHSMLDLCTTPDRHKLRPLWLPPLVRAETLIFTLMVRTNNKSTKSRTKPAEQEVIEEATQVQNQAIDFDIDPELLGSEYNQIRRPVLPYGIVINDNPAGILIPEDQLEKANWFAMPDDDDLTTVTLSEDVTGLLLTK